MPCTIPTCVPARVPLFAVHALGVHVPSLWLHSQRVSCPTLSPVHARPLRLVAGTFFFLYEKHKEKKGTGRETLPVACQRYPFAAKFA